MEDTYKTVSAPSEGLFKDKGSRFISYLYPVTTEEEIKEIIQQVKKAHHSARHHCYAWRLGRENIRFRANDDGEPSSTAGKPILGQLTSFELTNVLLVVVRYFGGTLLGTSGLINAYREAASEAIRNAVVETRIIEAEYRLQFGYNELNQVMQIIKNENLKQTAIQLEESCRIDLSVRKSEAARIENLFGNIYGVTLSRLEESC